MNPRLKYIAVCLVLIGFGVSVSLNAARACELFRLVFLEPLKL